MKYNIGDILFKTKKECEQYTRNIINKLGCCIIDNKHENFKFFKDLLKNHPEHIDKIGIGLKSFEIIRNPNNYKAYHINIIRIDNTKIDFSWIYCCKFKLINIDYLFNSALRNTINDYIQSFKNSCKIYECNICKNIKEKHLLQVDHITEFKDLKNEFLLKFTGNIPTEFIECNYTYKTIFKESDYMFKNEWYNFHNSKCKLQLLCNQCHKLKTYGNK